MKTKPADLKGLRRRWLVPLMTMVLLMAVTIYWEMVSRQMNLVDAEIDRTAATAVAHLARRMAAPIATRQLTEMYSQLRSQRTDEPDIISGAIFDEKGRPLVNNDPYHFNSLPAPLYLNTPAMRIVRYRGFDTFIQPIETSGGKRLGYAALKVSRARLTESALRVVRKTLATASALVAIILLMLHLLLGRVEAAGQDLDMRVDERTAALRTANEALADEITRRQQAQLELAAARDAALRSTKMKSEFIANMSHEIRTPINGVIGMSEILLSSDLNDEQFHSAMAVKQSGESLLSIINDILDFSKIEAGKLTFESIPFDPRQILEDVADLMSVSARHKGLEMSVSTDPRMPANLKGDPQRFRQIVMNLVGNAVKFTKSGEVLIESYVEQADDEGVLMRFDVLDTGIGITPAALKRIFQPFSQGDGSTARSFGGTGLGLVICRQLAERMGGRIEVEPRKSAGTRFSCFLRFERETEMGVVPTMSPWDPLVLLVEPHEATRISLAQELGALGARVESFTGTPADAALAARLKSAPPFDLAVIDTMSLILDGQTLTSANRAGTALELTRIFASAYAMDRRTLSPAIASGDGWLRKPVRRSDLKDVLSNSCRLPAIKRAPAEKTAPAPAKSAIRHRILLAEDNEINARVATSQLRSLGYECVAVVNGLEALEALKGGSFDLVLMDCQMPDMDGYAATAELRRRENGGRRIPVVAMTAHAMSEEKLRCIEAGMDDYVSKPVSKLLLGQMLRKWLTSWDESLAHSNGAHEGAPPERVRSSFLKGLPGNVAALCSAMREGEKVKSAELARGLSGAAASAGFMRLSALAEEAEYRSSVGQLAGWEGLPRAFEDAVRDAFSRMKDGRADEKRTELAS